MPPILELLTAATMILGPVGHVEPRKPAPLPRPPAGRSLMVPLAELQIVLGVAGDKLDKLVQREEDHAARAIFRNEQTAAMVEWRTLRVSGVHDAGVREADKRRGISKRYLCKVRAMSHRTRPLDQASWSEWQDGSHPSFPNLIEVVCSQGRWQAKLPSRNGFSPHRSEPGKAE